MKTREDKRMVKLGFYSKLPFFGHILEKSTHSLCGAHAVIPLGPHLVYT